jgi:phosphatidylethanolamine/phosphatidyl-N-methylethanolamine N-methyltransferase
MFARTNRWRRVTYNLYAGGYDLVVRIFSGARRRAIEGLALRPGERLLIAGAGTGLDLPHIPRGVRIAAVDISPRMLDRLKRRAARLGIEVDARAGDAQALEFPDASFDAALLHLILAVVPDPVRCAREAARVLRPGGRASIFDKFAPDGARPPLILRLLNPLATIVASELTRQLGPILEGSGLEIVREESRGPSGYLKIVTVERKDRK